MINTRKLRGLLAAAAMTLALPAAAQLAGKNVILVHGFQYTDLTNPPTSLQQVEQNGYAYWQAFWDAHADARIDWASNLRVEGGIAQEVFTQLKQISQQGLCNNGCVFVTHSTGDLVTRYLLENQAHWLQSVGLQPLKVLTVIDFAGAGGGTELANLAMDIAYSDSWTDDAAKLAVMAFTGVYPTPTNMGVVNDLQTTTARNIAVSPTSIPHLRFVGGGSEYGGITSPFISGTDDGVVPLHSACGSATVGAYDSCVNYVDLTGFRTSVSAPGSLYYNYFPVLMSDGINHSEMIDNTTGNSMTYADNNFTAGGIAVDFSTYTYQYRPWWKFWGDPYTYQNVTNAENYSMSGIVYQTLNQ